MKQLTRGIIMAKEKTTRVIDRNIFKIQGNKEIRLANVRVPEMENLLGLLSFNLNRDILFFLWFSFPFYEVFLWDVCL